MCVNCVAEGIVYVGGALGGLQVMAVRARSKRLDLRLPDASETDAGQVQPVGREGTQQRT